MGCYFNGSKQVIYGSTQSESHDLSTRKQQKIGFKSTVLSWFNEYSQIRQNEMNSKILEVWATGR